MCISAGVVFGKITNGVIKDRHRDKDEVYFSESDDPEMNGHSYRLGRDYLFEKGSDNMQDPYIWYPLFLKFGNNITWTRRAVILQMIDELDAKGESWWIELKKTQGFQEKKIDLKKIVEDGKTYRTPSTIGGIKKVKKCDEVFRHMLDHLRITAKILKKDQSAVEKVSAEIWSKYGLNPYDVTNPYVLKKYHNFVKSNFPDMTPVIEMIAVDLDNMEWSEPTLDHIVEDQNPDHEIDIRIRRKEVDIKKSDIIYDESAELSTKSYKEGLKTPCPKNVENNKMSNSKKIMDIIKSTPIELGVDDDFVFNKVEPSEDGSEEDTIITKAEGQLHKKTDDPTEKPHGSKRYLSSLAIM